MKIFKSILIHDTFFPFPSEYTDYPYLRSRRAPLQFSLFFNRNRYFRFPAPFILKEIRKIDFKTDRPTLSDSSLSWGLFYGSTDLFFTPNLLVDLRRQFSLIHKFFCFPFSPVFYLILFPLFLNFSMFLRFFHFFTRFCQL